MREENTDVVEVLTKALEESKSETVDIVVEHELCGVTPQMLDWFFPRTEKFYKLWHPEDHISWEWEVLPQRGRPGGAIHIAEQKFGKLPICKMRIRIEAPDASPFTYIYSDDKKWSTFLGPGDKAIGCATHEYKEEPYGTLMHSTFRFPAKTPQWLLDAVRQHNIEEMGQLTKFLPELYKQQAN